MKLLAHYCIFVGLFLTTLLIGNAYAQDGSTIIKETQEGKTEIAKFVVDTAPGKVSAMTLLGTSADQTSVIEHPKNLTLALGVFDSNKTFGLSITPARTSLLPMSIKSYSESDLSRLWAATTFAYAQGQANVNSVQFDRRALSVETSYYLFPRKDDPLMMNWIAIKNAELKDGISCYIIQTPTKPIQSGTATMEEDKPSNEQIKKQAQLCRDSVTKTARWNVSRIWASYASGELQATDGGVSHSLGKTAVLGFTWGFGDKGDSTTSAITMAVKKITNAPEIKSLVTSTPSFRNDTIASLKFAIGTETARALVEASNSKSVAPTTASRAYKRAIGVDLKVSEDIWLNFRYGNQRRIDNKGDERGSSLVLSYSPKAILGF